MPFKYSQGNAASSDFVFLTYGGTSAERNVTGSPALARTLGVFTVTESGAFGAIYAFALTTLVCS